MGSTLSCDARKGLGTTRQLAQEGETLGTIPKHGPASSPGAESEECPQDEGTVSDLAAFLLQVVVITLSGAMAPGPITAATLAAGTRSRHAGGLIALGHGIVELPLMILVMAGAGTLLTSKTVTICVGLIGGVVLVLMGSGMIKSLRKPETVAAAPTTKSPIWTGVVLTGANPYFYLWWVAVGPKLTSSALEIGAFALGLLALIHWLCDLIWLEVLSFAGFGGTKVLGDRAQKGVLGFCSVALIGLGLFFVIDAARKL